MLCWAPAWARRSLSSAVVGWVGFGDCWLRLWGGCWRRVGEGFDPEDGGGGYFEVVFGGEVEAELVALGFGAEAVDLAAVGEGDVFGGAGQRAEERRCCEEAEFDCGTHCYEKATRVVGQMLGWFVSLGGLRQEQAKKLTQRTQRRSAQRTQRKAIAGGWSWEFGAGALQVLVEEAAHEELHEGVGVAAEADLGVGGAGGFAGEAFGVNGELERGYGADGGIDGHGYGDYVVEGGVEGVAGGPEVVELGEGVGEVGVGVEEEVAAGLVELDLGGVERRDEERDAGGEEGLGGGDVHLDVVFGFGAVAGVVAEVVVAAADRAAHDDDALEQPEGGGVLLDDGSDVGEGAESDEGDLVGVLLYLVEQEGDCVGVRLVGDAGPLCLRRGAGAADAGGDGDFGSAGFAEETVDEAGFGGGVAPGGGDAEDLELGAGEGEAEGEGVVYVVGYVGVDED